MVKRSQVSSFYKSIYRLSEIPKTKNIGKGYDLYGTTKMQWLRYCNDEQKEQS